MNLIVVTSTYFQHFPPHSTSRQNNTAFRMQPHHRFSSLTLLRPDQLCTTYRRIPLCFTNRKLYLALPCYVRHCNNQKNIILQLVVLSPHSLLSRYNYIFLSKSVNESIYDNFRQLPANSIYSIVSRV
jgi:hypothetical protein